MATWMRIRRNSFFRSIRDALWKIWPRVRILRKSRSDPGATGTLPWMGKIRPPRPRRCCAYRQSDQADELAALMLAGLLQAAQGLEVELVSDAMLTAVSRVGTVEKLKPLPGMRIRCAAAGLAARRLHVHAVAPTISRSKHGGGHMAVEGRQRKVEGQTAGVTGRTHGSVTLAPMRRGARITAIKKPALESIRSGNTR